MEIVMITARQLTRELLKSVTALTTIAIRRLTKVFKTTTMLTPMVMDMVRVQQQLLAQHLRAT